MKNKKNWKFTSKSKKLSLLVHATAMWHKEMAEKKSEVQKTNICVADNYIILSSSSEYAEEKFGTVFKPQANQSGRQPMLTCLNLTCCMSTNC